MTPRWTEQQTAAFFNVPVQTLKNARCTGVGAFADLEYEKYGRLVRYNPTKCRALAAASRQAREDPEAA